MPFNLRNMDDERKARMGVGECVNHRLVEPFQVLYEREGKHIISCKVGSVSDPFHFYADPRNSFRDNGSVSGSGSGSDKFQFFFLIFSV